MDNTSSKAGIYVFRVHYRRFILIWYPLQESSIIWSRQNEVAQSHSVVDVFSMTFSSWVSPSTKGKYRKFTKNSLNEIIDNPTFYFTANGISLVLQFPNKIWFALRFVLKKLMNKAECFVRRNDRCFHPKRRWFHCLPVVWTDQKIKSISFIWLL